MEDTRVCALENRFRRNAMDAHATRRTPFSPVNPFLATGFISAPLSLSPRKVARFYDLMLTNASTCQNNRPTLSVDSAHCASALAQFCCQYVLAMFVQNANGFANVYAMDYCGMRSPSMCIGQPAGPKPPPSVLPIFRCVCVREIRVARKVAKNIKPQLWLWPGGWADNNNNNRPASGNGNGSGKWLKSHQEIYGPKLCCVKGVFKLNPFRQIPDLMLIWRAACQLPGAAN